MLKRTPLKRKPYKLKVRKPLKKKSKLRKHSNRAIPKLIRKLWILFSLYIRRRDNWICFTCGNTDTDHRKIHAGHFISRKVKSTLFDPMNVHAQCASCNLYLYGNPGNYAKRLILKYGKKEFDSLVERGNRPKQWTERELQRLIDVLKAEGDYEEEYKKIKI